MKKFLLLLHFTFGIFCFTFSQTLPGIEWQNTIGGSHDDFARQIYQTRDGGYLIGGSSKSNISCDKTENNWDTSLYSKDYWIIKTDSESNIQWQNAIGGTYMDELLVSKQTIDGGYILGGYSESNLSGDKTEQNIGYADYWIIKTDSTGNIQWQNTIGGTKSDYLTSLDQTIDNGYIIGGSSFSGISGDKTDNNWDTTLLTPDFWIIKIDSSGNLLWQKTIGSYKSEMLHSIKQTVDGGYIIGGSSNSNIGGNKIENSNGLWDYWVVKIDSIGNIQWQNTIGGSIEDDLNSVYPTTDRGYILGGVSKSNISGDKTENNRDSTLGSADYWLVKIDSIGYVQWDNTIGGNNFEIFGFIQEDLGEGYIVGGSSRSGISGDKTEVNRDSTLSSPDYWLIKLDFMGNIKWQNTFGTDRHDWLTSLAQTSDNGYILGGVSNSEISYDKTENNCDSTLLSSDYWIIKLYPDTTTGISNIQPSTNNFQLYPNPTKDEITIAGYTLQNNQPAQLKIFNVMGNEVLIQSITNLNSQIINLKSFASGVYFVQLQSGLKVSRAKFVKQ